GAVILFGTPADRWDQIRQTLLEKVWQGVFLVSLVGTPLSVSRALLTGWQQVYTLHVALALVIVVGYVFRARIPFTARSAVVILILNVVGVAGVFSFGLLGLSFWWLFLGSLLASMLFSIRSGVVLAVVSLCALVAAGAGFVTRVLTIKFDVNTYVIQPSTW